MLAFGCGSKTKKIDETEKRKVETSVIKQGDSVLKFEKKLTEKTENTIEHAKNLNRADDSESVTNTRIDYKGGEPLEIDTPSGKVKISGSGTVNLTSEKKTKSSQQLHESDQQKISQLLLSEANLAIEVKAMHRIDLLRVEEITKLKQKDVQRSASVVWLWLVIIIEFVLIVVLCYFLFYKKTSIIGKIVS